MQIQIEIVGTPGTEWTDDPRDLTPEESAKIAGLDRLSAIKFHRELTHSTLAAAVRAVDALRASA